MNSLMASEENPSLVKWADLPAELLGIVSGGLGNAIEIVRFRSVCRSWRSSTPLSPPNKLSALFPGKVPFFGDAMITASAVYLVRPRSDPSKAWLVSVEEPVPGKLVLRHALTYKEMNSDIGLDLEPDWIAATQTPIARFYAHNIRCNCPQCHGANITRKLVCVSEISEESGCSQLVGLCTYGTDVNLAIKLELGGGGGGLEATQFSPTDASILDCVKFNGRIFAVDVRGHIYVLDHHTNNLQRVQAATEKPVRGKYNNWYRFVVSNGDLYLVWIFYKNHNHSGCEIYRLKVKVAVTNKGGTCCVRRILSKRVGDLGDRVFFITQACSFSISARLLPDPWRREGNCVFISDFPDFPQLRDGPVAEHAIKYEHVVFRRRIFTGLWTPEGHSYSDLFSPPTSFNSRRPFIFMYSGLL